jgi:hypothetical protein
MDWASVTMRSMLGSSHLQHMDWEWPTTRSMLASVHLLLNTDWEFDLVFPSREYDHLHRDLVLLVHC